MGIAAFKHNPQAQAPEFDLNGNPLPEAGQWVDLQPLGTEGQNLSGGKPYNLIQLAIPIGIGVKVRLPDNFDAHIEIGFRQLFTDYIDDVSGKYPDLSLFDDELTRALSERSREPVGILSGEERIYNGNPVPSKSWAFVQEDGSTERYLVGENYGYDPNRPEDIANRGSSAQKDLYMITQLRLVYIFGPCIQKESQIQIIIHLLSCLQIMLKYIKWPILSAFIVISSVTNAQLIEFGGGFGGLSYAGDLSRGIKSTNQNFAFQGHYRMNLSKIVSTKFALTLGKISGSDQVPIDPAAGLRNASFRQIYYGNGRVI